jgi:hypothetical protein
MPGAILLRAPDGHRPGPGRFSSGMPARLVVPPARFIGVAEAFERDRRAAGKLDREPEATAPDLDMAA